MIVSGLIAQCRREYNDVAKSSQAEKAADGVSTLYNLGRAPVIEGSYAVFFDAVQKTEATHYTLDKDSGDLQTLAAQSQGVLVKANFKYAQFRDQHWVEAINHGVEALNARGFFRQVVRESGTMGLSANVTSYAAPSATIDLYEVLRRGTGAVSATLSPMPGNYSYQQDANKLVLGYVPAIAERLVVSRLRNLQTYQATSATLDVLNDWVELVKLKAGAYFMRHMAAKIATQGAAVIEDGHFSFTNCRTMANDLDADFDRLAARKKPARPSKDILFAT